MGGHPPSPCGISMSVALLPAFCRGAHPSFLVCKLKGKGFMIQCASFCGWHPFSKAIPCPRLFLVSLSPETPRALPRVSLSPAGQEGGVLAVQGVCGGRCYMPRLSLVWTVSAGRAALGATALGPGAACPLVPTGSALQALLGLSPLCSAGRGSGDCTSASPSLAFPELLIPLAPRKCPANSSPPQSWLHGESNQVSTLLPHPSLQSRDCQ